MQQMQTYHERSRHYLSQALEEFRQGDLLQASEKGWGAAAQIIKALADERRINHRHHSSLQVVVDTMMQETGDTDFNVLFESANGLHRNFYEGRMARATVELHLQRVARFVDKVEGLLNGGFPPSRE